MVQMEKLEGGGTGPAIYQCTGIYLIELPNGTIVFLFIIFLSIFPPLVLDANVQVGDTVCPHINTCDLTPQTPLLLHQSSQTEIHLQDIPAKARGNSIPPPCCSHTIGYYGNHSCCSRRLPSNWPSFEDTRGLLIALSFSVIPFKPFK